LEGFIQVSGLIAATAKKPRTSQFSQITGGQAARNRVPTRVSSTHRAATRIFRHEPQKTPAA
jgi:DNA gyrase inhibitor GyrI